jgi:NTP pyrophosphatase (non-canonical NTP hydrolase)
MNVKILEKAIEVYGRDAQIEMIIEECSELIFAIQKFKRCTDHDSDLRAKLLFNVRDEIADVSVMIKQAMLIFGVESVNERLEYKMFRLESKMIEDKNRNINQKQ